MPFATTGILLVVKRDDCIKFVQTNVLYYTVKYKFSESSPLIVLFIFCFRALAVPTADYTYDDCRVAVKAGQLGLPMTSNLITVERLRSRLG